ncbi:unnamed protein product [Musa acuminata var. zebrina]
MLVCRIMMHPTPPAQLSESGLLCTERTQVSLLGRLCIALALESGRRLHFMQQIADGKLTGGTALIRDIIFRRQFILRVAGGKRTAKHQTSHLATSSPPPRPPDVKHTASHVPIDVVTKAFDGSGFMLMLRFIANRFGNAMSHRGLTLQEKIARSFAWAYDDEADGRGIDKAPCRG